MTKREKAERAVIDAAVAQAANLRRLSDVFDKPVDEMHIRPDERRLYDAVARMMELPDDEADEPDPGFTAAVNKFGEAINRQNEVRAALLAAAKEMRDVVKQWPPLHAGGDYLHGFPLTQLEAAIKAAEGE